MNDRLTTINRLFLGLFFLTLLVVAVIIVLGVQRGTITWERSVWAWERFVGAPGPQVAIIAGHRRHDTGAMCEDGLMEVTVTENVANQVHQLLEQRRVKSEVLDEYDYRLNGLRAAALLSIHADSCIDRSGFKVASGEETVLPEQDQALVQCITQTYAAATGLPFDQQTITEDMTGYHAFQRVADSTPGAIIELGFLGGDRALLTEEQARLAQGIADGILCYLQSPQAAQTPTLAPTAQDAPSK